MCNNQRGTPRGQPPDGLLHGNFRFGVQRRGGFIKNQNRRVLVERACNRQPLALAARQLHRIVAQHGVQAFWKPGQQGRQVCGFEAVPDPGCIDRLPKGHVVGNAAVEHHHMLADHRKLRAQACQVPTANLLAVEGDSALRDFDKTGQQVHQGCLAGSRSPHDGKRFSGRN